MNNSARPADTFLASLPPNSATDSLRVLKLRLLSRKEKIVVIDDDPTGTQTVHDVPVLTDWSVQTLSSELSSDSKVIFLLTNSRSLPLFEAQSINREIGNNLIRVAQEVDQKFVVISRSDSTLRGHFPGEVQALAEGMGLRFDAWLLIPFFEDGRRYTIANTHYVLSGNSLIPSGETEFARDPVFGYKSSNLVDWILEKTSGRVSKDKIDSISLEDIRLGGTKKVTEKLLALPTGSICIVNAVNDLDLAVFTLGLLDAEDQGRRYLHRTAASFVAIRGGFERKPLLSDDELDMQKKGGLIAVGSHVPKTNTQLSALLEHGEISRIEIVVERLLSDLDKFREIRRVAQFVEAGLKNDKDVLIFTSRKVKFAKDSNESLHLSRTISNALATLIRMISTRPAYILAKGGITSSVIATSGLSVKRAIVLGQIASGVPVWKLGPESLWPGLIFVVFPGNVGDKETLTQVWARLANRPGR